jgi:hypothetical protein
MQGRPNFSYELWKLQQLNIVFCTFFLIGVWTFYDKLQTTEHTTELNAWETINI